MKKQLVYGLHAVLALLNNQRREVYQILVNQDRNDQRLRVILNTAQARKIPIKSLSNEHFKLHFSEIPHQGVIAEAAPIQTYTEADLTSLVETFPQPSFILILDGITDPHNLGACLRSADAAGVDCVIAPKDNSADITPVVSKVSSGATESIPFIRVTNLARVIKLLQSLGVWVYGAAAEATQSIYELDCRATSIALVMGAEGHGLRRLTRETCDGLFSIPMYGQVSSLNVSVAAGVCLFEVARQRLA